MTASPALPASITAALEPDLRLSTTATAKLIRKALKEAFPEVTFSVRSSTYAGGSSIDVSWTDGPITALVDPITSPFAGAGFDGMCDLKFSKYQTMGGRPVHFRADYVHTHREISKARMDAMEAEIAKVDRGLWRTVLIEAGHPSPTTAVNHSHTPREIAWSLLSSVCEDKWRERRSATAESIETLGNTHDEKPV